MQETPIRVLIADDHEVVRAGLKALLETEPEIRVVAEVGNGADAISCVELLDPDVVIMDVAMPLVDGLAATREIATRFPRSRVLILTVHPEDERLIAAIDAGASAYLVKSEAEREIGPAVRVVARGGVYLRASAKRLVAMRLSGESGLPARARCDLLSKRERDVMRLIAEGCTAAEIGARLEISPRAVETYKCRIDEKFNRSRDIRRPLHMAG